MKLDAIALTVELIYNYNTTIELIECVEVVCVLQTAQTWLA